MHDTTAIAALQQQAATRLQPQPELYGTASPLPDHGLSAPPRAAIIFLISRSNIRTAARARTMPGSGAIGRRLMRRTGASLRRHADAAAKRRRTVRPPLFGADRRIPDGRAFDHWPGGDKHLARAAQRAGVPYMLSTAGGATIEESDKAALPLLVPGSVTYSRNHEKVSGPR